QLTAKRDGGERLTGEVMEVPRDPLPLGDGRQVPDPRVLGSQRRRFAAEANVRLDGESDQPDQGEGRTKGEEDKRRRYRREGHRPDGEERDGTETPDQDPACHESG